MILKSNISKAILDGLIIGFVTFVLIFVSFGAALDSDGDFGKTSMFFLTFAVSPILYIFGQPWSSLLVSKFGEKHLFDVLALGPSINACILVSIVRFLILRQRQKPHPQSQAKESL